MKKKIILCTMMVLVMATCGCGKKNENTASKGDASVEQEATTGDAETSFEVTDYGTYEISKGWVKNEEHSTNERTFFVKAEDNDKERPNNIFVSGGVNNYSKDDYENFGKSIMANLTSQLQGQDISVNAGGTTTLNGYMVYIVSLKDATSVTTQYYIIGDYKHVLVGESTFGTDVEGCDECAKNIVNTFKWNE